MQAWDSQGIHRTATNGDQAGADWLAHEAGEIIGNVGFEAFPLERLDPVVAYVEIDGRRIQGVPLFEAPPTPPDGVSALASDGAGEGLVELRELPPTAVYSPAFAKQRRETRHRAQLIVTKGGAPGLALLNAEHFDAPFGPPALQVSSTDRDFIFAAFRRGVEFRVVSTSGRTSSVARNVVLTVPGTDRSLPPVVVMAPRSSWWQSTSERGGGIVCWLETLRALKAKPPRCDVVFAATSGHELGHIGLDNFMTRRKGWETRAIWIHFGANIGAVGSKLSIQSADDYLRTLASEQLTASGQKPDLLAEKSVVPGGETRDIHRAGGRYLTLVSSNPLFHLPQDRWPDSVDVPAITRIAAGMAQAVVTLTR